MKSLFAFLFISLAMHGLVFFSFHLFGEKTLSNENLGKQLTTQFEVKKGVKKRQSPISKKVFPKTASEISKEGVTTSPEAIKKQADSDSYAQEKKAESLASVRGLLNINRPLTDAEKYKVYIYRKINNYKEYPEAAQKLKQEGLVVMKLNISSSGAFTTSLYKECPFSRLNKAAQKTFDSIGRFKPFPKSFKQEGWSVTVPFNYTLKN